MVRLGTELAVGLELPWTGDGGISQGCLPFSLSCTFHGVSTWSSSRSKRNVNALYVHSGEGDVPLSQQTGCDFPRSFAATCQQGMREKLWTLSLEHVFC